MLLKGQHGAAPGRQRQPEIGDCPVGDDRAVSPQRGDKLVSSKTAVKIPAADANKFRESSRQAWLLRLIVALIVGGVVAGCGSSTSSSSGSSAASGHRSRAAPSDSTQAATSFWRQQVSAKYQGPVATGDGRGCALASKTRWVCTAYVRKSDQNVDVFGAVTASGGVMAAKFHLNRGDEITKWFTQTGGGCQTDSCKGTRLKSGS
jgi:hypothetical protein